MSFIREMWTFLRTRRKLWMLPIIAIMVMIGLLLLLAQGSAFGPFIYTLF